MIYLWIYLAGIGAVFVAGAVISAWDVANDRMLSGERGLVVASLAVGWPLFAAALPFIAIWFCLVRVFRIVTGRSRRQVEAECHALADARTRHHETAAQHKALAAQFRTDGLDFAAELEDQAAEEQTRKAELANNALYYLMEAQDRRRQAQAVCGPYRDYDRKRFTTQANEFTEKARSYQRELRP